MRNIEEEVPFLDDYFVKKNRKKSFYFKGNICCGYMSFNYYTILNNSWKKNLKILGGVLFIIEWFIKKFWKKNLRIFQERVMSV